ncbi:MAG: HAMP domain-containing histidine kinase [Polyangiaceae bacterium]|nr:HAMP domain-containing histidine kinase [Polyangiaceae bacterium]
MATQRLTRAELAWLLAQEAHGAAKALREEVKQLKVPKPTAVVEVRVPSLEGNLDVLDDAIAALSDLQQQAPSGRRARIDLASLVGSLAPQARLALAPGAGTEVIADENDLRRMLHVLLCPTSGSGDTVQTTVVDIEIRGEADFVKVSVPLGPDQSATAEIERRWLSRMAARLGGRLELARGEQSLYLPTGGISTLHEVDDLRRELEQAKQLGEAYARELAEVFASSVAPPPADLEAQAPVGRAELDALRNVGAAIVRQVKPVLDGMHDDIQSIQLELGPGSPLPHSLAQRMSAIRELMAELSRAAACPANESPAVVDIGSLCRSVASEADERATRHGVRLKVDATALAPTLVPPAALTFLVRSLLDHAIAATPRDATVFLATTTTPRGLLLRCVDGGPSVPVRTRDDLLHHRVDPTSLGRPAGMGLLTVLAVAKVLGASVALEDAPGGGLVVEVVIPTGN